MPITVKITLIVVAFALGGEILVMNILRKILIKGLRQELYELKAAVANSLVIREYGVKIELLASLSRTTTLVQVRDITQRIRNFSEKERIALEGATKT